MHDDNELDGLKVKSMVELGGDLSTWSVNDIDARITELEEEIGRLRKDKDQKQGNLAAAEAFFKS